MIYAITLTNKPDYVLDAKSSVAGQRRACRHILQADGGDWGGRYGPAVFFNETARGLDADDYLFWLSDDDYLMPDYVEALAGALDAHPEYGAVYGLSIHIDYSLEAGWQSPMRRILPAQGSVFDTDTLPIGKLDGGQVMVRRSALDAIEYPYAPESNDWYRRVSDGAFLNKIAQACGIHPVPRIVMLNRSTPISGHTKSNVSSNPTS